MWRYRELLPVRDDAFKLSLGEGFTPLFRTARLERETGHGPLYVKDEGLNPTGSFKARGLLGGRVAGLRAGRPARSPSRRPATPAAP